MKDKIIRDSVHGYITIPEIYINKFIDTEVFQRLRNIEQTSIKCLYPCARHDRFSHSMGTFYVGRMLIKALVDNLKMHNHMCFKAFSDREWKKIAKTFELACLLHDCAHSPFSHVLEKYMDCPYDPADGREGLLADSLSKAVGAYDPAFSDKKSLMSCTSNHEKASALLLWIKFKDDIVSLQADPIWAMRMILGYAYAPARDIREKVLNCIFSLLNGTHMDADKLDYIVRDTASSGIDNFSVDLYRLISSVTIVKLPNEVLAIGYLQKSINVVQNMISAKNNLYLWIYAHHKVQYNAYLICTCFEKAVSLLFKLDPITEKDKIAALCSHIISVDAMKERTEVGSHTRKEIVYLPIDFDILLLIKEAYNLHPGDDDFAELFSRVYKKSVWKSYAEFKTLFNFSELDATAMYDVVESRSEEIIESLCKAFKNNSNLSKKECWAIFNAKAKLSTTENSKIYIQFYNKVEEYSRISNVENNELPAFFYLYHRGNTLIGKDKKTVVEIIRSFTN